MPETSYPTRSYLVHYQFEHWQTHHLEVYSAIITSCEDESHARETIMTHAHTLPKLHITLISAELPAHANSLRHFAAITPRQLYPLEQVAETIGVSTRTLENRIKDKKLEAIRRDGHYLVSAQAQAKYQAYREKYPHGHVYEYTDPLD